MSSFLSNKYLKYQRLMEHTVPPIGDDVLCGTCGYNLRGLNPGRNCPECGNEIPFEKRPNDPLLSGTLGDKATMSWGLALLTVSAAGEAALRVVFAVIWALSHRGVIPLWTFIALTLTIAIAWSAGAVLSLPRRLDVIAPRRRWLRLIGRWSQIAWPLAMILWLLAATKYAFTPAAGRLLAWTYLLLAIGGIGWLMAAYVLQQMSEESELDDAPRRIGLAIYVVPVLSVVLFIMPLDARFFLLAMFGPIVLAWAWYSLGFALGVWEMRVQVAWSLRMAADAGDRQQRMMQVRQELDAQAVETVRALPKDAPEARRPLKID